MLKIGGPHLADQIKHGVGRLFQLLLRPLQHIMVIRAGQAFIAGDHNIAHLVRFHLRPGIKILMLDFRRMVKDIGDGVDDLVKIGLRVGSLLAGLAQIGGGDQIHGVGDLQGFPNALDVVPDFFYACHAGLTCSL